VDRDSTGLPMSVELPRRSGPSILVLPQNENAGWVATVNGRELPSQRVDGWKQGWQVPGGDAATVTFRYEPETAFGIALAAGGVGLLICLVGAALRPRRKLLDRAPLPTLAPGRVGILDAGAALAAGGLLVGWYGVGAVAAAILAGLAVRRFDGWGALAGAAMLLVGAGLSWDRITLASWANEWRQAWSLVAVACLVAALAAARRDPASGTGAVRASADDPEPASSPP
jgi:arabinofuranan 3-O-arabinosyltransferase